MLLVHRGPSFLAGVRRYLSCAAKGLLQLLTWVEDWGRGGARLLQWLVDTEQKATCRVPASVRLCGFLTDPTRKAMTRPGQAREVSTIFHSCR